MKYVKGEITVQGADSIGMKIGLINSSGNFIRKERIIVLEGISVGGAESITPKHAKAKQPKNSATIKTSGAIILNPSVIPIITGITATIKPNANDAQISPKIIVVKVIGDATRRSNVLAIVSQGKTAGPMELAVNRSTIPSNPDTIYKGAIVRLIVKAKYNNIGKRIPKIITGPLL